MHRDTAKRIVEDLVCHPMFELGAEPNDAFDDGLNINVTLNTLDTSYCNLADGGYENAPEVRITQTFAVSCSELATPEDVAHCVLDKVLQALQHEMREFLRFRSSLVAPFHPHNRDGQVAWAEKAGTSPNADFSFGTVRG